MKPWLTVLFALAVAPPAAAQARDTTRTDTTVYVIPEIRVEFARPIATVGGASAISLRLDSLALPPAPSLDQVLREVPTVHVRTNSRGESEISVRGSESRQVAVLVDGVPVTLGWDARTDVSVVPATAPQEISVVRGLSSILHGPNVLGGIVEMSVGQGTHFPSASTVHLSSGIDHVGGWGASVTGTSPFRTESGQWLVRAGAGYRNSPGAPLADGVTEPVPTDDDLRLNTDVSNVDGFLAMRYRGESGGWFSLSGSGYSAERGIAAELDVEEPRFWRYPLIRRMIAVVSGGTGDRATPLGRGDLEASVGIDVGRTEINAYDSRAYDALSGYENGDDRTYTLRLLGDHTLGSRGDLRTAFTWSTINHDGDIDGELTTYEQRLWSLGGETVWRLVEDRGSLSSVRLSLGAAVDHGSTPETGGREPLADLTDWGARVGVSAALNGGDLLLHGGASRRGRFPALRELYSESLNRFVPNPDLVPEHLLAFEAGTTARVGQGELQAVAFHHRLSDAIRRITLPDGRRQRVNAEQIRSTGVELLLSQTIGRVGVGGDLTFQAVDLIDPGNDESTEPENLPEVFGGGYVRFPIILGVDGSVDGRYTGTQFCQNPDTREDQELDAGTRFNATIARVFGFTARQGTLSRIEVRAGVDNLTDVALYDQCGLPEPGRLFRFQVRVF